MSKPLYNFGDIVVVEGDLTGVVVESWGPNRFGAYSHDVYVRKYNTIKEFEEVDIERFTYEKELVGE